MRLTATVEERFSAAHRLEGHSICGRVHGHAWTVALTVEGGLPPKAFDVVDHGLLALALRRVIDEFDGDNLADYLTGGIPSPTGLCLYVRERLILDHPNIVSIDVRVEPENFSARVEWPLR